MDDQLYAELLHFHTASEGRYPERIDRLKYGQHKKDEKTKFRQMAKVYHQVEGVLWYGQSEVLPKCRLASVLYAFHDDPNTGGHFGRDKVYNKIKARYYWKGMKNEIAQYIKNCRTCFVFEPKMTAEAPPLNPITVPTKVWSLVGIDLIGPLQETHKGNKYIAAITCHFSKWSEAGAIPNKTAESVATFLFHTICRLGCMDTIISDQGTEFNNKLLDKMLEMFQTQHNITSAYHPQSNGQRERDNRTLKGSLNKLVNKHGSDWENYIPGVLLAYHSSVHASTGCTPFEVMYGRKAKLPLDRKTPVDEETIGVIDENVLEELAGLQTTLHKRVEEKIIKAQKHQKKCYDNRHYSGKSLEIGSEVYIRNPKRAGRKGDKTTPIWLGSYYVYKCLKKGSVKLKNEQGNILKRTYHATNLKVKRYNPVEDNETSSQDVENPPLQDADDPPSQDRNLPISQDEAENNDQLQDIGAISTSQDSESPSQDVNDFRAQDGNGNTSHVETAHQSQYVDVISPLHNAEPPFKDMIDPLSQPDTVNHYRDNDSISLLQKDDPSFQYVNDPHSKVVHVAFSQGSNDHQQHKDTPSIEPAESMDIIYMDTVPVKNSNSKGFQPPLSKIRKKMATNLGIKSVHKVYFGRAPNLDKPKKYHKTFPDGNCFFRCISYILTGSEEFHIIVRNKVVEHMSEISENIKGYLDKHPDIYISQSGIENGGIWATDAEILTTAHLLKCDIVVYTLRGNANSEWLTHPASLRLLNASDNKIYLENVNGNHYDVVTHV